jgi:hypothetical protein
MRSQDPNEPHYRGAIGFAAEPIHPSQQCRADSVDLERSRMSVWNRSSVSVLTAALCSSWATAALCRPHGAAPARKPIDLSIRKPSAEESFIVHGRRFKLAPTMNYGDDPAPWEAEQKHHDVMTGADIMPFGNAYAIGSPLGSDERNNETGGPYTAPRHN